MKRVLIYLLTILIIFSMTGCSSNSILLTDEESDSIAEYSAYLLLKNDKNYNAKLLELDELQRKKDEDEKKTKEEMIPTSIPVTVPTETPVDISPDDSDVNENPGKEQSESFLSSASLNELFGLKYFTIEYEGYDITDDYYENGENDETSNYFTITAPKNNKILIVKFHITNSSKKDRTFSTLDLNMDYQLLTSTNESYEPRLSLLNNDFQFYNKTIKTKETKEAVLLFFIKEKIQNGSLNLRVIGGSDSDGNRMSYEINLKK